MHYSPSNDRYLLVRPVELPFEEEIEPKSGRTVREVLEEVQDPFEQRNRLRETQDGIEFGAFLPTAGSITQLMLHREDETIR